MIRISALNSDSEGSLGRSLPVAKASVVTKEAQEAEVFSLYNKALDSVKKGEKDEAKRIFRSVLEHPLIKQAEYKEGEDETGPTPPARVLKYSTYKNLATISYQDDRHTEAMEYFLQAVEVDSSDVTVWYKIGQLALKLHHYPLARHAFQQGLECNSRHWPCLDNIITIMYALNNYHMCLHYIAQALERDPGYVKGLGLMQRIYADQPYIQRDTMHLFHDCDASVYDTIIEDEEAEEFISEALAIRKKKQEMCKRAELPVATFSRPLTHYRWPDLGERLLALYDHIQVSVQARSGKREQGLMFGCKVDLSPYLDLDPPVTTSTKPVAMEIAYSPGMPPATSLATTTGNTAVPMVQGVAPLAAPSSDLLVSLATLQTQALATGMPNTSAVLPSPVSLGTQLPGNTALETQAVTSLAGGSLESDVNVQESRDNQDAKSLDECEIIDILNVDDPELKGSYIVPHDLGVLSGESGSERGGIGAQVRAGAKRKKPWREEDMLYGGKRRSSRVRNVVRKKEEEVVNYQELLVKFLPSSLIYGRRNMEKENDLQFEEAMDTTPSSVATKAPVATTPDPEILLSKCEKEKVKKFVADFQCNNGVIELLGEWCMALADEALLKWPSELCGLYVKCYDKARQHMEYPNYLCKDYPDERIRSMAEMCLAYSELRVDSWMAQRATLTAVATPGNSPRKSPQAKLTTLLGRDYVGPCFSEDIDYLVGMSCLAEIFGERWRSFCARLFWMRAKFMILENNMDLAIDSYYRVLEFLKTNEDGEEQGCDITIWLPNSTVHQHITKEFVDREIASLERCQSLEKVHRLHEGGDYGAVVSLLLETFHQTRSHIVEVVERHEQLQLLQDSLLQLKDYAKCLLWSEVSLNEALRRYYSASSKAIKQDWTATMAGLLQGIDTSLVKDASAVNKLPSKNLVRFAQNLVSILEGCLEAAENISDIPIQSHLPWVILYRLIKHEERRMQVSADDLPASMMLLNFAHEYLGRRSLCLSSEGRLLLFIAEEFMAELQAGGGGGGGAEEPHELKEDLENAIGQCFYCLYGHPNKRTKAKHLQDHNVSQIELTWQRAVQVFDFFKPKTMPEYDSLRTSTVSAELENLLKRIVVLIPQDNYSGNTYESVSAYIEGTINQEPALPEGKQIVVPVVKEIYYLLADYYFKNKEQGKAIKFYIHDLCMNPERFDSWAGMALARSSRLEQRLNSHELKNDPATVQKQAHSALRCFVRALKLDNSNAKLWIEYGSLAYQLYSYLSRTIKQQGVFALAEDVLQLTARNKQEMLRIAHDAYGRAGRCEESVDEPWLQHYMLGKITEKLGCEPTVFLRHYQQAAECLHEERAKYPKKITYILSPPFLSVETVEVFYRLHVCALKYLLKHESDIREMSLKTAHAVPASGPEKAPNESQTGQRTNKECAANIESENAESVGKPKLENSPQGKKNPESSSQEKSAQNQIDAKQSTQSEHDKNEEKQRKVENTTNFEVLEETKDQETKTKRKEDGEKAGSSGLREKPFYLDVFREYVEASLKSPFALCQEKEKPKLKIAERPEAEAGVSSTGVAVPTGAITVKTPTRASRLDHTYSSCSKPVYSMAAGTDTSSQESIDTSVLTSPKSALTSPPIVSSSPVSSPRSVASSIAGVGNTSFITPVLPCDDVQVPHKVSEGIGSDVIGTPAAPNDGTPKAAEQPTLPRYESFGFQLSTCNEAPVTMETSKIESKQDSETVAAGTSARESPSVPKARLSFSMDNILEMPSRKTEDHKPESSAVGSGRVEEASKIKQVEQAAESIGVELECVDNCQTDFVAGSNEKRENIDDVTMEKCSGKDRDLSLDEKVNSAEQLVVRKSNSATPDAMKSENKILQVSMETDPGAADTTVTESQATKSIGDNPTVAMDTEVGTKAPTSDQTLNSDQTYETAMDSVNSSFNTAVSLDTTGVVTLDTSREGEVEFAALEAIEFLSRAMQSHSQDTPQACALPGQEISARQGEKSADSCAAKDSSPVDTEDAGKKGGADDSERVEISHDLSKSPRNLAPETDFKTGVAMETVDVQAASVPKSDSKPNVSSISDRGEEQDEQKVEKKRDENSDGQKLEIDNNECKDMESAGDELDSLKAFISKLDQSLHRESKDIKPETEPVAEEKEGKEEVKETNENEQRSERKEELNMAPIGNVEIKEKNEVREIKDVESKPVAQSSLSEAASKSDQSQKRIESRTTPEAASQIPEVKQEKETEGKKALEEEPKQEKETESKKALAEEEASEQCLATAYENVMRKSMGALELCLGRFPQHYKSLYRLSYIYNHSKIFKDVSKSRDLLLGNKEKAWQALSHMPCPGLFQERKNANFFQGLWRIPVEDIDRSGSFATHMSKSISLAFDVLIEAMDHKTLYQIHVQLSRTPEQGKKYLRENERVLLARQAFEYCFDVIADWLPIVEKTDDEEERHKFLLDVHRFWQHGVRHQISVKRINAIFTDVYLACATHKIESGATTSLEKAMKYCQQLAQLKTAQAALARASDGASSVGTSQSPSLASTPGGIASPGVMGQGSVASPSVNPVLDPAKLTQAMLSTLSPPVPDYPSPQLSPERPRLPGSHSTKPAPSASPDPSACVVPTSGSRMKPSLLREVGVSVTGAGPGGAMSPKRISPGGSVQLAGGTVVSVSPTKPVSSLANKTAQIRTILGDSIQPPYSRLPLSTMSLPPAPSRVTSSHVTSPPVTFPQTTSSSNRALIASTLLQSPSFQRAEAEVQNALMSALAKAASARDSAHRKEQPKPAVPPSEYSPPKVYITPGDGKQGQKLHKVYKGSGAVVAQSQSAQLKNEAQMTQTRQPTGSQSRGAIQHQPKFGDTLLKPGSPSYEHLLRQMISSSPGGVAPSARLKAPREKPEEASHDVAPSQVTSGHVSPVRREDSDDSDVIVLSSSQESDDDEVVY